MILSTEKVFSEGMIDQAKSTYNFLAMNVLFSQLQGNDKYQILDMGAVSRANIDFFSQFRCKIFVEDLYGTMRSELGERNRNTVEDFNIIDCLQEYPADTKFDYILFWDLFDYMEQDDLKNVIEHLRAYCKPKTMLFFITSCMDKIPQHPARFSIIDKQHLDYVNDSPTTRNSPGYKQSIYKSLLPGFTLYRGFRMSSGMEENLFVYEDFTR
jgi:hypothetical protein